MRRARPLILLSLLVVLVTLGVAWRVQREAARNEAPAAPARLPERVTAQAGKWSWRHAVGEFTRVEVLADDMRQVSEPSRYELRGVEVRIFDEKKPAACHRITSARADFDISDGVFFSEGEVTIAMDTAADGKPSGRAMQIRSSGVRFESKTGRVSTERPTFFTFDRGEGQSTGAEYDSNARELRMHKDVVLKWRGEKPGDTAMEVTAGNVFYKEAEAKIFLNPWAKLRRDTFTLESAGAVVTLAKGAIQLVEAKDGHGSDTRPNRKTDYAADQLNIDFGPKGEVTKVLGEGNARLTSTTATAVTTVTTKRVDLSFDAAAGESTLRRADANGAAVLESKPLPRSGGPLPDTRILRSETVILTMRPGGEEIDAVETHAPGEIEFIPNRPDSRHRTMKAERMSVKYGNANRMQSFRAFTVATRSDNPQPAGKPAVPPSLTWSRDLQAEFDPATGDMKRLEQWTDFRYEEGDRRARAEHATFDAASDVITLTGKARVWEPTGSTDSDRIVMNQRTGGFEAVGNVSSTRLPDKKPANPKAGSPSPMLTGDDPVQAQATRMTSAERNQKITYEGNAVMWQGANRLTADRIDIDRSATRLDARGNVNSRFVERENDANRDAPKKSGARKSDAPGNKMPRPGVFTSIVAPELTWFDKERVAHYRGGVTLSRPGLTVKSLELRAWMNDSTLEKAFAEGSVNIVMVSPGRTRAGTGEHGEYYPADEHMVLTGSPAQFTDSAKGTTRGRELTWYARNDRLLVEGAEAQPAITIFRRKH
ncbi:MAG TPA: LPS export ABC transporter periplasmic protein LptC [Bryobacteraceae bacterium]|nr:LPS export ABC transporter periplasmic protein LptC [Bryobacteraceae bacterium]